MRITAPAACSKYEITSFTHRLPYNHKHNLLHNHRFVVAHLFVILAALLPGYKAVAPLPTHHLKLFQLRRHLFDHSFQETLPPLPGHCLTFVMVGSA